MAGEQQIWHGDSAELATRLHPKRMIKSVITDPPFGVDNKSNSAVTPHGRAMARKILHDGTPEEAMDNFTRVMESTLPGMQDESDVYVFTSHQVLEKWLSFTRELFTPYDFERKAILTWEKSGPGQGDLDTWGMGCEFILYYKRGSRPPSEGMRRRNCVLHHQQVPAGKLIHPHEKPTDLLVDLIKFSTDPWDFVFDPFGGSGSLVRAAEQCDRFAVAIEKDKNNYDLAQKKFLEGQGAGLIPV